MFSEYTHFKDFLSGIMLPVVMYLYVIVVTDTIGEGKGNWKFTNKSDDNNSAQAQ